MINKRATECRCVICDLPLGSRPHEIILQHRAEGIYIIALCSKSLCWEALGRKMAESKR